MAFQDPFATASTQSQAISRDEGLRAYMLKIYNYMASALVLTGIVALGFAQAAITTDPQTGQFALSSLGQAVFMSPLRWVVIFSPLAMVMVMSFGFNRLSTATLQALYWAFAVVMGLSISSIFLVYTGESIARTFFITAGTFGGMSLYGYTTKRDLTGMGSFLIMGVWGLILASIVNLFMKSSGLSFGISILGVLIFVGLTAYDTQKLKHLYYQVAGSAEAMKKASIMGALNLYMDFINIFLYLLRFMGNRR
jgi:FtsH-binding integral membrane protein